MIIRNANVYTENGTFEKKDIYIEGDRITEANSNDDTIINAEGFYAIPGLTDIHFHGCVGYDLCDGTHEAMEAMAEYQAKNGITAIVPATMTLDTDRLNTIFNSISSYPNKNGADFIGVNMEGPYLSPLKKGAQAAEYIKAPDIDHFKTMMHLSGNKIKLVSVAPEEENAIDFIKELHKEVVISIAHTTADYNTTMDALKSGASHITHLYNAMPPFTHRSPGVIGAAFDWPNCTVELICDGIHIHPSVIRATFQLFGDDRIILISDSMMATGLEDGEYTLGGQAVYVKGNQATLQDGTLAGSVTNLMNCMRHAIDVGIPLESAVKCAAVNPVKKLGVYDKYGSITPGKYANIVLLNKNYEPTSIILKGKLIHADKTNPA